MSGTLQEFRGSERSTVAAASKEQPGGKEKGKRRSGRRAREKAAARAIGGGSESVTALAPSASAEPSTVGRRSSEQPVAAPALLTDPGVVGGRSDGRASAISAAAQTAAAALDPPANAAPIESAAFGSPAAGAAEAFSVAAESESTATPQLPAGLWPLAPRPGALSLQPSQPPPRRSPAAAAAVGGAEDDDDRAVKEALALLELRELPETAAGPSSAPGPGLAGFSAAAVAPTVRGASGAAVGFGQDGPFGAVSAGTGSENSAVQDTLQQGPSHGGESAGSVVFPAQGEMGVEAASAPARVAEGPPSEVEETFTCPISQVLACEQQDRQGPNTLPRSVLKSGPCQGH